MAEKRELILDLLSRNKMGPGAQAAAKDIDKVGTAADAAAKKTDKMGKASVAAERSSDMLGDTAGGTARKIEKLDTAIGKVNQDLVLLAGQLADADDAAGRMDISRGIRKAQADLQRMTKSKGILQTLLPDPKPAALSFMAKLGGSLAASGASIATKAGAHVGPVVGGAIGIAAAPVLVSSMSAALSAGAGAAAIGAGVALAVSKDKEIQQAGRAAGKKFADGLGKAAVTSYKAPIMQSIGILDQAGTRISKRWSEVFASTSGQIVPLVEKVVRAGEVISNSLAGAAVKSGPALDALGDSIGFVGDSVGHMIDVLGDGSTGAADNLRMLTGVLTDTVNMTTNFLGVLNQLSNNPWMTGPLLPMLREHYADAANETGTLTKRTKGLADGMTDAARAAQGHTDALVGLAAEMQAQTDPAFALLDAQDKVKESQKDLNEAIKEHGKDSKEARAASRNLAGAAVNLQGKVGALGETFDGNLSPAMEATMRAAGMTKKQIDGVRDEMNRARKAGGAYARNYSASVSVKGAAAARRSLYSVKDIIDDIPRAVNIAMKITGVTNVSKAAHAVRKNARASGGPVARGIPYLVGEHGPEMIVPEAAGRVLSAAATRGTVRAKDNGHRLTGGNPFNGGALAVRLDMVGPEEMRVFFRKMIRTMNLIPTAVG
jgi:hypothetical protein